jgi:hypothetical protein
MIFTLYSVLYLTNNKKIKKKRFLNNTNLIFKCVILQGRAARYFATQTAKGSMFSLVTYNLLTNKVYFS